jgi:hypothetical protein
MPDWRETKCTLSATTPDAGGNPGGDFRTNLEEYNAGTNPRLYEHIVWIDTEDRTHPAGPGQRVSWLATMETVLLVYWRYGDGNGKSNIHEFRAGVDPTDPGSRFQIAEAFTRVVTDGRRMILRGQSQPDRIYNFLAKSSLSDPPSSQRRSPSLIPANAISC